MRIKLFSESLIKEIDSNLNFQFHESMKLSRSPLVWFILFFFLTKQFSNSRFA